MDDVLPSYINVFKSSTVQVVCGIGISGFSLFLLHKFYRKWTYARLQKQWKEAPKDCVILHQFFRGKYCPNLSPFALKVETYLRLANIQYEVDIKMPFGPKGKCPWITLNGEEIGDSEFIIEKLERHFKVNLDDNLSQEELAVLDAAKILVEEHLFWCIISWRYWLDKCESFMKSQVFPTILGIFFPYFMASGIRKKAMIHGIGRHSPEEIYRLCRKDGDILCTILGNKDFFGGTFPCTADCAIFGGLSQIMWNAPESKYEEIVKGSFKSLQKYCLRMKENIYPDWEDLLVK